MRFKQYISEALLFVSIKDLPDWVKKVLKQKKIGKDVKVETTTKVKIGSNWHDANVRDIFAYKNGKVMSQMAIGTMQLGDTKKDIQAKQGFETPITPDQMILVTDTYPKQAKLYVHPDTMIKALEPPSNVKELAGPEILILVITRGRKPAFRREEAARFGLDYNSISLSLINKGFLMKNKAMNKKGKNFLLTHDLNGQVDDVASKVGIKRKGW